MSYQLNLVLSLLLIGLGAALLIIIIKRQITTEAAKRQVINREHLEMDYLVDEIKQMMVQLSTKYFERLLRSKEDYEREVNKRVELKKALKGCNSGSEEDKNYIIDYISDLLRQYLIKPEEVDKVIYFDKIRFLDSTDKFDILLYQYGKKYGNNGLARLIEEEHWDQPVEVEEENLPVYRISESMVDQAYIKRNIQLDYHDKIRIIAQRVYQRYKGFGVIDRIRDMAIDGISGGVSGVVDAVDVGEFSWYQKNDIIPRNYDSVWIFYAGKSIHLSFLSFGSERELQRVCKSIYRYNKAGQLSESTGYKVNEMKDGSRVVVVRPPFSESWAFFIRKFHIKNLALEELIQHRNAETLIQLLKFFMKGARITAITGSQGSGKTTLLMALIRYIYPTLTLRVQEMAFELNLRKLYPKRNILTFRETDHISGQEGLDLQKKTDGSVNILGEVATDEVSVLMLQTAQVASLFTIFTHHAKTVADLVLSLRNSLLKCNVFRDEKIAEQQVVKVLDFDIHLNKDYSGTRYIERITEIIPVQAEQAFSRAYRQSTEQPQVAMMDTVVQYFEKQTDHKTYQERVIIRYQDGAYVVQDPLSSQAIESMTAAMTSQDAVDFEQFLNRNWGNRYAVND